MISSIIISKDKACQTHLLLESIHQCAGNLFENTVIYDYSNLEFREGYLKLIQNFNDKCLKNFLYPPKYIESENLKESLLSCIENSREYVALFSDEDILFQRLARYKDIKNLFEEHNLLTLSLRLGNNTILQDIYDSSNYFSPTPEHGDFVLDKFLVWDAVQVEPYTNFALPLSVNGHIYKRDIIKNIISKVDFEDLESLDIAMQKPLYKNRYRNSIPTNMACFEYSVLITNSINRVILHKSDDLGVSDTSLNLRYLNNMKINREKIKLNNISRPYQSIEVEFKYEDHLLHSS